MAENPIGELEVMQRDLRNLCSIKNAILAYYYHNEVGGILVLT